jgi:hypothetical protein
MLHCLLQGPIAGSHHGKLAFWFISPAIVAADNIARRSSLTRIKVAKKFRSSDLSRRNGMLPISRQRRDGIDTDQCKNS